MEKTRSFSQPTEPLQTSVVEQQQIPQQTDRAPIIVSPNGQPIDTENSNSSSSSSIKDVACKVERSVIVRAGSSNICTPEIHNNIAKVRFYFQFSEFKR